MKKTRYFIHRNYQHVWINNKVRGANMQFVCFFSTFAEKKRIFNFPGGAATCVRWDG